MAGRRCPTARLALWADSGGAARLYLDDVLVVDEWDQLGQCQPCALNLSFTAGSRHRLVLEYWQQAMDQTLYLLWDLIGNDTDASIARAVQAAQPVRMWSSRWSGDSNGIPLVDATSGEGVDRVSLELDGQAAGARAVPGRARHCRWCC